MIVSVVRDLVTKHSKSELEQAAQTFETKLENTLGVDGKDDGEKLSNLLAAIEVKSRMDAGAPMNEALREFSQRVRSILTPNPKK